MSTLIWFETTSNSLTIRLDGLVKLKNVRLDLKSLLGLLSTLS